MTLPQLSDLIYKKSNGLISIEDSKAFLTSVYNDAHERGYNNGYRQCTIDRRQLKYLCKSINLDMVNEFYDECVNMDIFNLKALSKHPDLVRKYKELFNSDVIF